MKTLRATLTLLWLVPLWACASTEPTPPHGPTTAAPLHPACLSQDAEACSQAAATLWEQGADTDAQRHYLKACQLGDPSACYFAAHLAPTESDTDIALYTQACDGGFSIACGKLPPTALALIHLDSHLKACQLGKQDACLEAHFTLFSPTDDAPTRTQLAQAFRGNVAAYLGRHTPKQLHPTPSEPCQPGQPATAEVCYRHALRASDPALRRSHYNLACDADHAISCNTLGALILSQPSPTDADKDRAIQAFRRGCALEEAAACYNLGLSYFHGETDEPDLTQAAHYWAIACEQGDPDACLRIGIIIDLSHETPDMKEEAAAYYFRACELGGTEGCTNFALYLLQLPDETREPQLARAYLSLACVLGDPLACINAHILWENGDGIAPDPERAQILQERACALGHTEACPDL